MKAILVSLLLLFSFSANAQFTVVSTSPADGATSVPRVTTMSITFSSAIDTTKPINMQQGVITNIDTILVQSYSVDLFTVNFSVRLKESTVHVFLLTSSTGKNGSMLDVPYAFTFTASPALPAATVSGTVLSGASGVSPGHAIVVLSRGPLSQGTPDIAGAAVAGNDGSFTLSHVPAGTYYPIAAKDVSGDGFINPAQGDVIAEASPITVTTANVSGVVLSFKIVPPVAFTEAVDSAAILAGGLPSDKVFRGIAARDVDSLGRAYRWEFDYTRDSYQHSSVITIGATEGNFVAVMDSQRYMGSQNKMPMTALPPGGVVDSFLVRTFRLAGREMRDFAKADTLEFDSELRIGDMAWTQFNFMVPDASKMYLAVQYSAGRSGGPLGWQSVRTRTFLGDYSTGSLLATTGVAESKAGSQVKEYSLRQNYPNPFNPSTRISYTLSAKSIVTLTVYNMLGQIVATLVHGEQIAGVHEIEWRPIASSGLYFYRLEASGDSGQRFIRTMKMILMK